MEPTDQEKNAELPPITGRANITLEPNTLQARGVVYWAHEVDAAIVELGGDPKDKAWDKWDIGHIFAAARLARELKAAYGATVTITPRQRYVFALDAQSVTAGAPVLGTPSLTVTDSGKGEDSVSVTVQLGTSTIGVYGPPATVAIGKRKPGPKPLTPDELMEIAWQLEQSGQAQIPFAEGNTRGISRYAVQKAVKYCAENPDNFRQFQAEKVLELERRKEARRQ